MVLTQTTKHYLSNLDAGYTPIPNLNDERKIGIYGLKAKVFTLVVVLLLIFSLVNFMVLLMLVIHMRMTLYGMDNLVFIASKLNVFQKSLLLNQNSVINVPVISSLKNENLDFILNEPLNSENLALKINIEAQNSSIEYNLNENKFTFKSDNFKLSNHLNNFNQYNLHINLLNNAKLNVTKHTNLYVSNITPLSNNSEISLSAGKRFYLRAFKELTLNQEEIQFNNLNHILIQTRNQQNNDVLKLNSENIYINIPRVWSLSNNQSTDKQNSYKLCMCENSGRLFIITFNHFEAKRYAVSCAHIEDFMRVCPKRFI